MQSRPTVGSSVSGLVPFSIHSFYIYMIHLLLLAAVELESLRRRSIIRDQSVIMVTRKPIPLAVEKRRLMLNLYYFVATTLMKKLSNLLILYVKISILKWGLIGIQGLLQQASRGHMRYCNVFALSLGLFFRIQLIFCDFNYEGFQRGEMFWQILGSFLKSSMKILAQEYRKILGFLLLSAKIGFPKLWLKNFKDAFHHLCFLLVCERNYFVTLKMTTSCYKTATI